MWRKMTGVLLAALCFGCLTWQGGMAKDPDQRKKENAQISNVVLQENELSGLKIYKELSRQWWKGRDSGGKLVESPGLEQECEADGVKVRVHYCKLASTDEAHEAADFYAHNMAAIFKKGLWSGASQKVIGDESWFSYDAGNIGLLIRSGRICALVSCRASDAEKQKRVAELIAKRIVEKIALGGKVRESKRIKGGEEGIKGGGSL
jgi:phosphoribosyl-AMP cyclohydrolase